MHPEWDERRPHKWPGHVALTATSGDCSDARSAVTLLSARRGLGCCRLRVSKAGCVGVLQSGGEQPRYALWRRRRRRAEDRASKVREKGARAPKGAIRSTSRPSNLRARSGPPPAPLPRTPRAVQRTPARHRLRQNSRLSAELFDEIRLRAEALAQRSEWLVPDNVIVFGKRKVSTEAVDEQTFAVNDVVRSDACNRFSSTRPPPES